MSFDAPTPAQYDGSALRIAVVAARYNETLVNGLLASVDRVLHAAGVLPENIVVERVPGSGELPFTMQALLGHASFDVGIALGVVIKGGTLHDQLVAEGAQNGLVRVGLDARRPVIAGIVAANNAEQAAERCLGPTDRGAEFAHAALAMATLHRKLSSGS